MKNFRFLVLAIFAFWLNQATAQTVSVVTDQTGYVPTSNVVVGGDAITYKTAIINTSPTVAVSAGYKFTANLPLGATYVAGSVRVNSINVPGTEGNISDLRNPVFTLPVILPSAQTIISIDITLNCGYDFSANQTTAYTVIISNASGCSISKSISLQPRTDFAGIKPNNVMSPNGDGKNDTFRIKNLDMYPNNILRIFDKAGKIIYEGKNYKNDWDGTYRGKPLAENTYYYVLDFGPGYGSIKGFFNIIIDN